MWRVTPPGELYNCTGPGGVSDVRPVHDHVTVISGGEDTSTETRHTLGWKITFTECFVGH